MVRFGRRHKARSRETRHSTGAAPLAAGSTALKLDQGPGEYGTRSVMTPDPAQQLLACLGKFQRELAKARNADESVQWVDACMAELLEATELALTRGWKRIFDALTGTGRVLQSYENAGKAAAAASFLDDAHEILCLMAGEVITGNRSDSLRDRWQSRYGEEIAQLQSAGVALVDDNGGGGSKTETHTSGPNPGRKAAATELNTAGDKTMSANTTAINNESNTALWPGAEELPTLEELPPLDELAAVENETIAEDTATADGSEVEAAPEEAIEIRQEEEAIPIEPVEPESTDVSDARSMPTDTMVSTVDTLCDRLGQLSKAESEEHPQLLEEIERELETLRSEASLHEQEVANRLAERVIDTCRKTAAAQRWDAESFSDLAFAFCGVYMESLDEESCDAAENWVRECNAYEESLASDNQTPLEVQCDSSDDSEAPVSDIQTAETPQAEAHEPERARRNGSGREPTADVASRRETDSALSQELLASAQRAALQGDGEGAKLYALQAAANIARVEVLKAERFLHDSENRLKKSLESIQEARSGVKQAEVGVRDAQTRVASSESDLGGAQEHSAVVTQELEDVENKVEELERQIQELQRIRDAELQNIETVTNRLELAREEEGKSAAQLGAARRSEEDARRHLERTRQDVKDMQRMSTDIENQLESARERLTNEKASLADIVQTLGQLASDDEKEPRTSAEETLF